MVNRGKLELSFPHHHSNQTSIVPNDIDKLFSSSFKPKNASFSLLKFHFFVISFCGSPPYKTMSFHNVLQFSRFTVGWP